MMRLETRKSHRQKKKRWKNRSSLNSCNICNRVLTMTLCFSRSMPMLRPRSDMHAWVSWHVELKDVRVMSGSGGGKERGCGSGLESRTCCKTELRATYPRAGGEKREMEEGKPLNPRLQEGGGGVLTVGPWRVYGLVCCIGAIPLYGWVGKVLCSSDICSRTLTGEIIFLLRECGIEREKQRSGNDSMVQDSRSRSA
jgi:hypothetical protein